MNFTQSTLDFYSTGEQLRDAGIQRLADTAESLSPGWSDKAYEILLDYLKTGPREFMTEDVREYAAMIDFTAPASKRAWGGVMVRAKGNKLIEAIGIGSVKNPRAHCANATIWRVRNLIN